MPRFSVAFTKRKPASEFVDNAPVTSPDAPSFRVIERPQVETGRSFDGGARMARASQSLPLKNNLLDLNGEHNMFAEPKVNRGSDISHTTKGTSTDNSSRHSNASTAPSSADMNGPQSQETRSPPRPAPKEEPVHTRSKSLTSGFLDRATRTFSFGGQKKHTIPPPLPTYDPIPDLPPVLGLGGETLGLGTLRSTTASTDSTATPAQPASGGALDLGGDFSSMFKNFDKRASTATLTLTNQATTAPRALTSNHYPTSPDTITPTEPLLSQRRSPTNGDKTASVLPYSRDDAPPPVPRHEHLNSFKSSNRPPNIVEDDDAKFLRESRSALKFLSEPSDSSSYSRSRRGDEYSAASGTIASGFQKEENMFEGSFSRINRVTHHYIPRRLNTPRNKVMTPAEFEKYRQDKEGSSKPQQADSQNNRAPAKDQVDDDDDEINYDDDEDEQEKSKQQAKQRRKQEAHMAVYRQQMMKVTGETIPTPLPTRQPARPHLASSSTAPALGRSVLNPSPDPATTGASSEDDDEDVPLAILQAHGFPQTNKPVDRLNPSGSSPNLRASMVGSSAGRPASVVGDATSTNARPRSALPAFARNLPQDPFVGASIARPAIRESLAFGDAGQLPPQPQGPLPPGGLVGVIVNEERSRAMRRGSPTVDPSKLVGGAMNGHGQQGLDPYAAIPPHMMYNGAGEMPGMPGVPQMHQMPPPLLSPGDQAQIQMTQQMQQFMQMQMQFMQMMATNQNGSASMQQPTAMQPPPSGGLPRNQSMGDLSRQSMVVDPNMEAHMATDPRMRSMSMLQPSSASFMGPVRHGPPVSPSHLSPGNAYSPSIAPSERSNVGLPGRYRPVSQTPLPKSPVSDQARLSTVSGSLSTLSDDKSKSTVKLMNESREGSDDDEEQGWEAMKAKKEKKQSIWRRKRASIAELHAAV